MRALFPYTGLASCLYRICSISSDKRIFLDDPLFQDAAGASGVQSKQRRLPKQHVLILFRIFSKNLAAVPLKQAGFPTGLCTPVSRKGWIASRWPGLTPSNKLSSHKKSSRATGSCSLCCHHIQNGGLRLITQTLHLGCHLRRAAAVPFHPKGRSSRGIWFFDGIK